ncbi:hypothetical protein AAEP93_009365 [Penicillium crustosum]
MCRGVPLLPAGLSVSVATAVAATSPAMIGLRQQQSSQDRLCVNNCVSQDRLCVINCVSQDRLCVINCVSQDRSASTTILAGGVLRNQGLQSFRDYGCHCHEPSDVRLALPHSE